MGIKTLLEAWKEQELISSLDYHLALFFSKFNPSPKDLEQDRFIFLVVWISMELRAGHVCIDVSELNKAQFLSRFPQDSVEQLMSILGHPKMSDWIKLLNATDVSLVNKLENSASIEHNSDDVAPFIFQHGRLYFQRLWRYEAAVADFLKQDENLNQMNGSELKSFKSIISQIFPSQNSSDEIDWQKVAVATSLLYPVSIISGGPGTGKTTTVSKILAGLLLANSESEQSLLIIAAAPTGKAAARLTESLNHAIDSLDVSPLIKEQLQIKGVTLHRLLGARQNSQTYFYHSGNPLNVDVLLIDEASMIDLSLMAHIIDALPKLSTKQHNKKKQTKLILLGDKEQLASVEAGSVFGDICRLSELGVSSSHINNISTLTGYALPNPVSAEGFIVADQIALLHKSYRFHEGSGIGQLASAVKEGNVKQALTILSSNKYPDVELCTEISGVVKSSFYQSMIEVLVDDYLPYFDKVKLNSAYPEKILEAFNQYRVLAALRRSAFGVEWLNINLEKRLIEKGLIETGDWYEGRPIMITQNQPILNLFNGDIGVTLKDNSGQFKVYFAMATGEIQGFSAYVLAEYETCYVMTVHKSQGSEFDKIAIILPETPNAILNRSLLYTGITRAKMSLTIYASNSILKESIKNQTQRQSGLFERLQSNIN